jgi:hypothetical protein
LLVQGQDDSVGVARKLHRVVVAREVAWHVAGCEDSVPFEPDDGVLLDKPIGDYREGHTEQDDGDRCDRQDGYEDAAPHGTS